MFGWRHVVAGAFITYNRLYWTMKLIIGPPNSGKTQRAIELLAGWIKRRHSRAVLIVPSEAWADSARATLATSLGLAELPPSLTNSVITFTRFYFRVLNRAGKSLRLVGGAERESLVRDSLFGLARQGSLAYFGDPTAKPGLVASLVHFVGELVASGVSAKEFISAARAPKDLDIARLFERYTATLDAMGSTDAELAGHAAFRAVEGRRVRRPFGLVAADQFDSYSGIQVRLLAALARNGTEVVATLDYEEGQPVHLWHEPTVRRFSKAGATIQTLTREPVSALETAGRQLMAEGETSSSRSSSKPVDEPAVVIVSAPDRAVEIRAVAREIKRALDSSVADTARVQPGDIAIVCRSNRFYVDYLKRIFSDASIPATIKTRSALGENQLVRSVLTLLRLHDSDFIRRMVLECLRSPYLDLSAFEIGEATINGLDRLSIHYRVTRGRDRWFAAISRAGDATEDNERATELTGLIDESREERKRRYDAMGAGLGRFFDVVRPAEFATRHDYSDWVLRLIEDLHIEQRAGEGVTAARDLEALRVFKGLLVEKVEAARAAGMNVDHAESLIDRPLPEEIPWATFVGEIERDARDLTTEQVEMIAMDSESAGAVAVHELHSRPPGRWRLVFVIGLVEGEFPLKLGEQSPYSRSERERLQRAGVDLTETSRDAGADVFQFYRLLMSGAERVYLSYARTDLAGGELLRSYLTDEMKQAAETVELRIAQNEFEGDLSETISVEELALHTSRALREGGCNEAALLKADALLREKLPSWRATVRAAPVERRRLAGRETGAHGGFIREPELAREISGEFGPDRIWSATEINDYGICPFRFMARHVLRLEDTSEPVEGLLARQLGRAYHRVLERVHRELKSRVESANSELSNEALAAADDSLVAVVDQACNDALDEMAAVGEISKDVLWEFEKTEIRRRVMRLLRTEAKWNSKHPAQPIMFERKFGIHGSPLVVGDVQVKGVIDRIDMRDDGLVVIDYKTGAAPITHREALIGRNLQLPIYLMAVRDVIWRGKRVAGGYYLHINSCRKGSEFPGGDAAASVDAIIGRAASYVREYAGRARRGEFPVRPNGPCPPYCEFSVMCRIQSLKSARDPS